MNVNLSLDNLPLKMVLSMDNIDSDLELVSRVVQNRSDAVNYFLTDFSQPILNYVAQHIMNKKCVINNGNPCYYPSIYGEYFAFIGSPIKEDKPQWHKLSLFEGKHGARLKTYVTTLTVRHFIKLRNAEIKNFNENNTVELKENSIIDTLIEYNDFDEDGLSSMSEEMRWAWSKLKEKDREVLTTLVIDEMAPIEAFDQLIKHINGAASKDSLSTSQKQTMMALLKHRAKKHLLSLIMEYRKKH